VSRAAILKFTPTEIDAAVRQGFEWIDWTKWVSSGARVFIKPNLTYPFYRPGVTTSPEVLASLAKLLRERTDNITIGESDGASYAWKAEESFAALRLEALTQKYGVRLVNLSQVPAEPAETEIAGRPVRVVLPSFLLHETDVFITVPVPKVHVMTGVSLGFKNQWGCLPDVKRLRHHPEFRHYVLGINRLLRTQLCLFDGTYFLDRTGPMDGEPVRMDLVVASDDPGAGSLVCCEIMGLDAKKIAHLRLAQRVGMMPARIEDIQLNAAPAQFRTRQFRLRRSFLHYAAAAAFRSRWATRVAYDSRLAKPLHELLYIFRGRPEDLSPKW